MILNPQMVLVSHVIFPILNRYRIYLISSLHIKELKKKEIEKGMREKKLKFFKKI